MKPLDNATIYIISGQEPGRADSYNARQHEALKASLTGLAGPGLLGEGILKQPERPALDCLILVDGAEKALNASVLLEYARLYAQPFVIKIGPSRACETLCVETGESDYIGEFSAVSESMAKLTDFYVSLNGDYYSISSFTTNLASTGTNGDGGANNASLY